MNIEEIPAVLAVENLSIEERQKLLDAVEEMFTIHHGSDWAKDVDYGHVDYMQENILGPALAKNVNAIVSDLNKESTLADLDYLFLLYETIENDTKKKILRRGSIIKPIPLEALPSHEVNIESLMLAVYAYCKENNFPIDNITLPKLPNEVNKFVKDTNVSDLALLVNDELDGLRRSIGGITQPTPEFWHMIDKIKNRH